jgi:hypothetical protein
VGRMNIFFLYRNPRKCAQAQCDKHVSKMLVEATQLLYLCHYLVGSPVPSTGYKMTHRHHPCGKWLTESIENYLWTIAFCWELADEYRFRYGQHKMHSCEVHLVWLETHIPTLPLVPRTPHALAMKPEYKISPNPILSYRYYYWASKDVERGILHYKRGRCRPAFLP